MPNSFQAGAVVYAKDASKVGAFYAQVADLRTTHMEQDYLVLESSAFQLVVLAIPAKLAASVRIVAPPRIRENSTIKLALPVESLASARLAARSLGGQINEPEQEWEFRGSRVCDGYDPEGNVVQFRENMR